MAHECHLAKGVLVDRVLLQSQQFIDYNATAPSVRQCVAQGWCEKMIGRRFDDARAERQVEIKNGDCLFLSR